jgi:predicted nucleic acid-binding protein
MRIYFDCCCLQRPFDDQSQPRVRVESEAMLAILAMVRGSEVSLLNSDVLLYEVNQTTDSNRRDEVLDILKLGDELIELDESTMQLAEEFAHSGVSPIDALHLAAASLARADLFVTCDDRLLRKTESLQGLSTVAVALIDAIREITK